MSVRIAFRARYGPYLHNGPPIDHVDAVHQVETATVDGTITPGTTQQETATIVGTIGVAGAGFAKITVTAAGMANSPKDISVAVANNDTAAQVAGKARSALGVDVDVIARFAVSGATDKIILTRLVAEADDGTLNIASDNDTCSGLTTEATSADTRAGVAPGTGDAVVTVTAAGMDNSPKDVAVAVVAGDSASVVAGKARTAFAADVDVSAFFTVGGTGPDIALTAKVAADHDETMNIAIDNDTCTGLTPAPTSTSTVGGAAGVVGSGEGKIEKGGELIDTVSGAHYINAGTRHEPAYRGAGGIASLLDIPGNWSIWDARTLGLDDGEPVIAWPDSGTNGFDAAQATANNQPVYVADSLNGIPAVRFDPSENPQFLTLDAPALAALFVGWEGFTILCVALKRDPNSAGALFEATDYDGNTSLQSQQIVLSDGVLEAHWQSANNATPVYEAEQTPAGPISAVYAFSYGAVAVDSGTSLQINASAHDGDVGELPAAPCTYIAIGGDDQSHGIQVGGWIGDLALVAVCDRALNARERRVALEYLSESFGTL